MNSAFKGDPTDVRDWPILEALIAHALALINNKESREEAESLMRRALQILIASYGDDHPHSQIVNNNYIQLLETMGKSEDKN